MLQMRAHTLHVIGFSPIRCHPLPRPRSQVAQFPSPLPWRTPSSRTLARVTRLSLQEADKRPRSVDQDRHPANSRFRGLVCGPCLFLPTVRRHTCADAGARLGVNVECHSFIAADLHRLIFAGFPGTLTIWMRMLTLIATSSRNKAVGAAAPQRT